MVERGIFILAAPTTIAGFLLEARRAWRDERDKRADDAGKQKGR